MIRTAFVVPLLIVLLASGAIASVTGTVQSSGSNTIYTYTYINTDATSDLITGFHVYAPVDASLVTDWSTVAGWSIGFDIDPTGAADIYWSTADPMNYGIASGESLVFSMAVPSYTTPVYDYGLQDFEYTNWGYDAFIGGGTYVGYDIIPVPVGSVADTPEPASILALCSGCAALVLRRRK